MLYYAEKNVTARFAYIIVYMQNELNFIQYIQKKTYYLYIFQINYNKFYINRNEEMLKNKIKENL